MRTRTKIVIAVAMSAATIVAMVAPVGAKPPASSGVVERFDAAGAAFVVDETEVHGELREIVAVFNFETVGDLCSLPPGFSSDAHLTLVITPAQQLNEQVKDTDVPVLVFDITGADVTSPPDFLQKLCGPEPTVSVLAVGTADIHQQFNASADGDFQVTFTARGHVFEHEGPSEWRLGAIFQEAGNLVDGTTDRLREQVRLH